MEYPKITIITPCSRVNNLELVGKSIRKNFNKCEVRWVIVFDGRKVPYALPPEESSLVSWVNEGGYGDPQRNRGLDLVLTGDMASYKNEWIYFLDDDNVIHPSFEGFFLRELHNNPEVGIVVFSQILKTGAMRVRAGNHLLSGNPIGKIDTAMFITRKDMIRNTRWTLPTEPCGDGRFFRDVRDKNPNKTAICDVAACYYNVLT